MASGCTFLPFLRRTLRVPASTKRVEGLYDRLEERIGYRFEDHSSLTQALTHSSVRSGGGGQDHYERLEFLGDRVLGLCIAELLHVHFPSAKEGELSLRLNALVRGRTLAEIADELGLHEYIRTGGDLKSVKGKRLQSVRADVLEAVIASIYLDGGIEEASAFIKRFWMKRLKESDAARRDSKTALQEWAHANRYGTPSYEEADRSGPDHDPEFTVNVRVAEHITMTGKGRSKRIAEQDAAKKVLVKQGVWKNLKDESAT